MKQLLSLLSIDFLVKEDALRNWRMVLFLSFLALMVIASGHSADKKIYEIARLNDEIKEMKSAFVEQRAHLMQLKMETRVLSVLSERGLKPAKTPPIALTPKVEQ